MATPHDYIATYTYPDMYVRTYVYSMDCTCSPLGVHTYLLQVEINIRKLQMSPSLYWEYIHVVSQCCCGHYTRDCTAPERSIHVIWKVRMLQYTNNVLIYV